MLQFLICGILTVWFILSVMNQLPLKWNATIARFDPCRLVPRWTFFAPRPGCTDYHLTYRTVGIDSSFSDWYEIPIVEERSIITALWNPRKRVRKTLLDIAQTLTLTQYAFGPNSHAIMLTLPYLALLNYVESYAAKDPDAAGVFFAIAETDGFIAAPTVRVLMRSAFHRLDRPTQVAAS